MGRAAPLEDRRLLIAISDGWVTDGEKEGFSHRGIFYDVEKQRIKDRRWSDVTIPMVATTLAKFVVRDIDGNAIAGAEVSVAPNQQAEFGPQMLGGVYPTLDYLNQPIPPTRKRNSMDRSRQRYVAVTDDTGFAVLTDLPVGSQMVTVTHERFRSKKNSFGGSFKQIELDGINKNEIELQMEPVKD